MTTKTKRTMGKVGVGAGSITIGGVAILLAKLVFGAGQMEEKVADNCKVNERQDVAISAMAADVSESKAAISGLQAGQHAMQANQERIINAIQNLNKGP